MDLTTTLICAVAVVLAGGFCGWRGARPPDPRRGPRMIPWRFLMLLCGTVLVYLAAHALELIRAARQVSGGLG